MTSSQNGCQFCERKQYETLWYREDMDNLGRASFRLAGVVQRDQLTALDIVTSALTRSHPLVWAKVSDSWTPEAMFAS
jgi:hypothetical protein